MKFNLFGFNITVTRQAPPVPAIGTVIHMKTGGIYSYLGKGRFAGRFPLVDMQVAYVLLDENSNIVIMSREHEVPFGARLMAYANTQTASMVKTGDELVLYVSHEGNPTYWVRPVGEFLERFEVYTETAWED